MQRRNLGGKFLEMEVWIAMDEILGDEVDDAMLVWYVQSTWLRENVQHV